MVLSITQELRLPPKLPSDQQWINNQLYIAVTNTHTHINVFDQIGMNLPWTTYRGKNNYSWEITGMHQKTPSCCFRGILNRLTLSLQLYNLQLQGLHLLWHSLHLCCLLPCLGCLKPKTGPTRSYGKLLTITEQISPVIENNLAFVQCFNIARRIRIIFLI